jgi:hypothetical protein
MPERPSRAFGSPDFSRVPISMSIASTSLAGTVTAITWHFLGFAFATVLLIASLCELLARRQARIVFKGNSVDPRSAMRSESNPAICETSASFPPIFKKTGGSRAPFCVLSVYARTASLTSATNSRKRAAEAALSKWARNFSASFIAAQFPWLASNTSSSTRAALTWAS